MTTRDTLQNYFGSLEQKRGWEAFLAEDMTFTNFSAPVKRVTGRGAYLEATKRFFAMNTALEVKTLVVEGEQACAAVRYELQLPGGSAFDCHVAEMFKVRNGKITSFGIYFDSTPFPK